jgi:hypothetical protein
VTVWSQLRSYLSWPTEALLVGPDTSSPQKWAAWGGSFILGLGLSLASCATVGRAVFTMSDRDGFWAIVVAAVAVLFLPLVVLGLVLPRVGGPVLILFSAAAVVSSLPASDWSVSSALGVVAAVALPLLVVGIGFTWSGLRPETQRGAKGGLA